MSKFLKSAGLIAALGLVASPALAEKLGLGRAAQPEEIAAWDLDVSPDGTGLPVGSGDVETGEALFSEKCAVCHGEFAEGVDNWPKLAGGEDTLADKDPVKTIGSYWPHLSTAWDYVNRSMPFGDAQSLTDDEVYAIVAYILYSNYLVEDDFELSNENFTEVVLPNADGFIVDDRVESEAHFWIAEPCMENCKDSVEITMRARVLDVTPEEEAAAENAVVTEAAAIQEEPVTEEPAAAAPDAALVSAGEKVFKKCKACHQVGDAAKNRVGPILNAVVGRSAGGIEDFKYSKPLKAMADEGLIWSEENLAAFLAKPKAFMKGTKMSFAGLKSDEDVDAIIAYLSTFGD